MTNKKSINTCKIYALLALITLSTAVYSISKLEPESKIPIKQGLSLYIMGGLFFTSLNNFFVHLAQQSSGQKMVKRYKLSDGEVLGIINNIVSTVQAIFGCLAGAMMCLYTCNRNMMRTTHYILHAYSWFGAPYFLYDIWSMYNVQMHMNKSTLNDTSKSSIGKFLQYVALNSLIVGHHIFIGTFGFVVVIYLKGNLGDCVFGFVFLMEASTPFVSLRSILSRLQIKSSKLYTYNGFVMMIVFFLCRIAMFPYVMYLYSLAVNLDYISAIISLSTSVKIIILILMLPQYYWFYLMAKGATKMLRNTSNQKAPTSKKKLSM